MLSVPDWESISAEDIATMFLFRYAEWVLNDNYAYEHLFLKSNILGHKKEHSTHDVMEGFHCYEYLFQKSYTVKVTVLSL
jgi:hypothetical protein